MTTEPTLQDNEARTTKGSVTTDRRTMMKQTTIASAALLGGSASIPAVHVVGKESGDPDRLIRIGLIGCGGRGTGALDDSFSINENVRLVAMADLNADKCQRAAASMVKRHEGKVDVQTDRIHVGLDGYQEILSAPDIDLVMIASPPGFHPIHTRDAVAAGKHVFCEKPSCIDVAGYHTCLAAYQQAEANRTAIVTGTQYRRQVNYIGAVEQIRDGRIGEIISATTRYCSNGIWFKNRKNGMTDAEYQIDNWMQFNWLSGDQICASGPQHRCAELGDGRTARIGVWVRRSIHPPRRQRDVGQHVGRLPVSGEPAVVADVSTNLWSRQRQRDRRLWDQWHRDHRSGERRLADHECGR